MTAIQTRMVSSFTYQPFIISTFVDNLRKTIKPKNFVTSTYWTWTFSVSSDVIIFFTPHINLSSTCSITPLPLSALYTVLLNQPVCEKMMQAVLFCSSISYLCTSLSEDRQQVWAAKSNTPQKYYQRLLRVWQKKRVSGEVFPDPNWAAKDKGCCTDC